MSKSHLPAQSSGTALSGSAESEATGVDGGTFGNRAASMQAVYGNSFVQGLTATTTSATAAPAGGTPQAAATPPGFDAAAKARLIHDALGGWGTDERGVLDVLYTGREDLVRAVEAAYNAAYRPSLAEALRAELDGADLDKALKLLQKGDLSLADKIREGAHGWGTDEDRIFNALERARPGEIAEVKGNAEVMGILGAELSDEDFALAQAYLEGKGQLAAQLRRAAEGWGTDEETIWRALSAASREEKAFVLAQPKLLGHLKSDLDESDWTRASRMLSGEFDNADRIAVAMAGWGTDEDALIAAIAALTSAEYARLPKDIDALIDGELSGRTVVLAHDALHQKRIEFDADYREAYMKRQEAALGKEALLHDGASAMLAQEGQAQSAVARLLAATTGMGTDDSTIWSVLAALSPSEREFIRTSNPDGVLDALKGDLSDGDYGRAIEMLGGAGQGASAALRQAIEGWGTDERLIYDAVDGAVRDGVGPELLADPALIDALRGDLSREQMAILGDVLASGTFTGVQRLEWATSGAGTNEELVFALSARFSAEWKKGDGVEPGVDAVLKRELSTRDYWTALDAIRGEPQTEQERLDRKKEELERERGSGVSAGLMDTFSSSGERADDAWREYQGSYNRAQADGEVTQTESLGLRQDEAFSERMTTEHRASKATAAQWATQIAVAIVGIAATVLTAGAAGPFVAGLAAALGGKVAVAAELMVLAAASKVGLNRAIQGEGYDVTSAEALIDACAASLEVGLSLVGGQVSKAAMEGLSKSAIAAKVGGSVERVFGGAGKRILSAGLEGSVDGALGGFGEGAFTAATREETWQGDGEAMVGKFAGTVFQRTAMSAGSGFLTQTAFQSLSEVYGGVVRARQGELGDDPAMHETPGDGEDVVRKQQEGELPGILEKHSQYKYEDIEKGKAFVKGESDGLDIDPNDVKQGALGDCYLMAGMAATARANPESIRRIVKDNGDGTFEVTLFIREKAFSTPKAITTTVDARLPTKGGTSLLYAKVGNSGADGDELWPALLEKTLAQHKDSYDLISGGNIAKGFEFHGATELFTGKPEGYFAASSLSEDKVMEMMQSALAGNKPITVDSQSMENLPDLTKEANAVNVYGNHAYAVKSVDAVARTVNLQNPWGSSHVVDLPIKDFKRFYRSIRVGGK